MYTRRGDKGETSLYGPRRVPKDSPRVEAYGTVDELNSYIGVILSGCTNQNVSASLKKIQNLLFVAGADLATDAGSAPKIPRIGDGDTKTVEKMTDDMLERLPTLSDFILPGGSKLAAELQFARAVCRRAERRIVTAASTEKINPELIPFFNRLSSYLFNLARHVNVLQETPEEPWKP